MIFITGDTHGRIDGYKLFALNDNYKGRKLTKNDYVIIVGDFGFVWDKESYKDLDFLSELDFTILFVDGNHENFEMLSKYEVERWQGGNVHHIRNNIVHLMRGQVYTISNKTIFTFGGAESIDKMYRKENFSWWPQEVPSKAEFDEAIKNLAKVNNKVDIILSHAVNTSTLLDVDSPMYGLHYCSSATTDMLEYFERYVEYDAWFFGHYHLDIEVSDKKVGLYHNIVKLSSTHKKSVTTK